MSTNKAPWTILAGLEPSQDFNYANLNKSYLEDLEEMVALQNGMDKLGYSERQSLIGDMLENIGETSSCRPRAEKIESVLAGADVQILRQDKAESPELTEMVAMLDDWSFTENRARKNRGPQNAHNLYKILKGLRFPARNQSSTYTSPNTNGTILATPLDLANPTPNDSSSLREINTKEDEPMSGAERRSIYIHNLDRWTICNLISTASAHEFCVLREALYNHLAAETCIDFKSLPGKPSIYQLAFHLPYYAWRSATVPVFDQRYDRKGKRLTEAIDVSFLDPNESEMAFMYSAQISCVITGSDMHRPTAYMFVDNIFDFQDSVQYFEHLRKDAEYFVHYDLFSRGFSDADRPIEDPEELFWFRLRIRMDQISNERTQNVAKLQQSFEKHGPVLAGMYCFSARNQPSAPDEETAFLWVDEIETLLGRLIECLSQTVQVTQNFWLDSVAKVRCLSTRTPISCLQLPEDVATTLKDLKDANDQLEKMAKRCRNFTEGRRLRMARDTVQENHRQGQLAQDNKGLSTIMTIFYPFVLTCSTFAISNLEDVIPFLYPNFKSFAASLFVSYLLTAALHIFLQYGSDYCKKAREKISWSLKGGKIGLTVVRFRQECFDGQRIPQQQDGV